jgi:hypothetical protein
MSDYNHGETIKYRAKAEDINGDGIANADLVLRIYRGNNEYWTGAAWQAAPFDLPMTEIDEVNHKGTWKYDFDTTPHNTTDDYFFEVIDNSGNAINQFEIDAFTVSDSGDLANIEADVKRLLALNHDNFVMDPLTYDANGSMLTGVVRAYDSKANADADDGVTGLLYTYDITGERTGAGYLGKYTQTRTL